MITLENEKEWMYVRDNIFPAGMGYEPSTKDEYTITLMGITYDVQLFRDNLTNDNIGIVTFPNRIKDSRINKECFYIHSGLSSHDIDMLKVDYALHRMDVNVVTIAYLLSRLILLKKGMSMPEEVLYGYIDSFSCKKLIRDAIKYNDIPFLRHNFEGMVDRVL
jgi:hypothetical protein